MATKPKPSHSPQTLEEAKAMIESLSAQLHAAHNHREKSLSLLAIQKAEIKLSAQAKRALYILDILGIDTEAYIPDSALRDMAKRIEGMW